MTKNVIIMNRLTFIPIALLPLSSRFLLESPAAIDTYSSNYLLYKGLKESSGA
jgi:hypothetical protein